MALFDAADAAKCLEHSSGSLRPHGRRCLNNTLDVLNDRFQMRKLVKGSLIIWNLQEEKWSRAGPSFSLPLSGIASARTRLWLNLKIQKLENQQYLLQKAQINTLQSKVNMCRCWRNILDLRQGPCYLESNPTKQKSLISMLVLVEAESNLKLLRWKMFLAKVGENHNRRFSSSSGEQRQQVESTDWYCATELCHRIQISTVMTPPERITAYARFNIHSTTFFESRISMLQSSIPGEDRFSCSFVYRVCVPSKCGNDALLPALYCRAGQGSRPLQRL